jgi:hypothetical protein
MVIELSKSKTKAKNNHSNSFNQVFISNFFLKAGHKGQENKLERDDGKQIVKSYTFISPMIVFVEKLPNQLSKSI